MSKHHSTVSRREFMKALGLAGAGLGAAAAAAPVFRDLDEVMGSPKAVRKLPWYITEREFFNPTVEVDWELRKQNRFDDRNSLLSSGLMSLDEEKTQVEKRKNLIIQGVLNNEPGNTLKDNALAISVSASAMTRLSVPMAAPKAAGPQFRQLFFTGNSNASSVLPTEPTFPFSPFGLDWTLDGLGLSRWEGTPEENLRMLTAALRFYGARSVGAVELTDKTKTIFKKCDKFGRPYRWDDVDHAYIDAKSIVLPNKAKWLVSWQIPQSPISLHNTRAQICTAGIFLGYMDVNIVRARTQIFIYFLGYEAITSDSGANVPGIGIVAGLGELGRHDYVVTPERGSLVRMTDYILTDLPLAPTKPIDFGGWRFCRTCKRCAEACPEEAIGFEDEPTWEVSGPWNGYGNKAWPINYRQCLRGRGAPGGDFAGDCNTCQGVCVFSKMPYASIHDVTKAIVATTPIFNGFFTTMDKTFGYGESRDSRDWWNRDPDTYELGRGDMMGY